jgi:beta-aspartyl-peptidase (threonine type)
MRWYLIGLIVSQFLVSLYGAEPVTAKPFAIALHGGAGFDPAQMSKEQFAAHRTALEKSLKLGEEMLAKGASAIDAVEAVVRSLEDEPLYNAGRGAVLNAAGQHELDASIMDGATRNCGAVAGVTTVRNPISLARLVMTETKHVLLQGAGAEKFADEQRDKQQIERVSNDWFTTPERKREWEAKRSKKMGTVGCVALDQAGHLAAATSTGGMTDKKWGRVGDSPIIGAGTYADDRTCAVSCTGTGEEYIRVSAAFHVHALMHYKQLSLVAATEELIHKILPADSGGLIAVDAQGRISTPMNTTGMARASRDAQGQRVIEIGPTK